MTIQIILFFIGLFLLTGYLAWNLKRNSKYFPEFKWTEIGVEELNEEQINYYSKLDSKLSNLGFQFFKMTFHENWNSNAIQRLYVSNENPTAFLMMESWAKNAKTRRILQLRTRFNDGYYLRTSAPKITSGIFKHNPKYKDISFWDEKEPKELFVIHRKNLENSAKGIERIFPDRFPGEIYEEKKQFLEMRLKCGDFEKIAPNDFYSYTWKFAIKTVFVMTNPLGRSAGVKYRLPKFLFSGFLFFSVFWVPQIIKPFLIKSNLIWTTQLLYTLIDPYVFYLGGLFLKKTGVKSLVGAYVLSFFPLAHIFSVSQISGFFCFLLLLLGLSVNEKKKKAENDRI